MDKKEILTGNDEEASQSHTLQVSVRMQQGEHTGQPMYSNFTAVQTGQGVVILDFGFLDPQALNALNTTVKLGKHTTDPITAKLSCRMAISIDAVNQLSQQLNQLFSVKAVQRPQAVQQETDSMRMETNPSSENNDIETKQKSVQSGFRFPWSKKTH